MQTTLTRVLLAVLALLGIAPGAWAAFAPESFYTDFPGFRSAWVSGDGPYNEHLIRDVGGFFLALGVLALLAAVSGKLLAARLAGAAWLVFSLVHAWYHLRHLQVDPEPIDQWLNGLGMVGSIVLSLLVLVLPGRRGSQ